MISNKYINKIIVAVLTIAVIFTAFVTLMPNSITASTIVQPDYISKAFDKDKITSFNIEISDENWQTILDDPTAEEYVCADVTINGEIFNNVGIRAKGNSTLRDVAKDNTTDRYSFKIKFDEYVKGQTYYGLDKLVLNNNYSDTTNMKEYLSYDLLTQMGIATPAFAYSEVKINDEYFGLYLAVEVIEESFLERNYGSSEGNLYKPESMGVAGGGNGQMSNMSQRPQPPGGIGGMNGSTGGANLVWVDEDASSYSTVLDSAVFKSTDHADKQKVIDMIKRLNAGTNLEEYLNVEQILRYFAVNTFLVNLDSYASNMKHNYYLYERDGIFEILPWDYNMSFAGFQAGDAASVINFPIDSPVTDTLENSPLIGKLLEVNEYKALYHKYLEEIVQYVNNGTFETTVNKVDTLISDYVKNDPTAFFTYEQYKKSLPELITFGTDRAKSIIAQLDGSQPSTTYGDIETTLNINSLGTIGGAGGRNNGGSPNNPPTDKNNNRPTNEQGMIRPNQTTNKVPPQDKNTVLGIETSNTTSLPIIILYSVSTAVLVFSILFVLKFNKRKYISK